MLLSNLIEVEVKVVIVSVAMSQACGSYHDFLDRGLHYCLEGSYWTKGSSVYDINYTLTITLGNTVVVVFRLWTDYYSEAPFGGARVISLISVFVEHYHPNVYFITQVQNNHSNVSILSHRYYTIIQTYTLCRIKNRFVNYYRPRHDIS